MQTQIHTKPHINVHTHIHTHIHKHISGSASFPLLRWWVQKERNSMLSADWVFRSCSCSSWALLRGVVPLLFALCRAHWLVSLSTLARYVRAWLEIFISIAIRFSPISSVLRWWVQKERNSMLSADWVFRSCSCSSWALLRGEVPLLFALGRAHWLVSLSTLARYVRAWLEIFISIAIRFSLISSVLRWWVQKERNSMLSADWEHKHILYTHTHAHTHTYSHTHIPTHKRIETQLPEGSGHEYSEQRRILRRVCRCIVRTYIRHNRGLPKGWCWVSLLSSSIPISMYYIPCTVDSLCLLCYAGLGEFISWLLFGTSFYGSRQYCRQYNYIYKYRYDVNIWSVSQYYYGQSVSQYVSNIDWVRGQYRK